MTPPRAGYTLPVFACAAAIAALRHLHDRTSPTTVTVDLLEPPETVEITVEQVACLSETSALVITRSDPGDNLDLTRNTPIWALVETIEETPHQDTKANSPSSPSPPLLCPQPSVHRQAEASYSPQSTSKAAKASAKSTQQTSLRSMPMRGG